MIRRLSKAFCKAKLYILAIPYAIWLAGCGMNQAVLAANGGKFPVMLNAKAIAEFVDFDGDLIDEIHCRMTADTRLNFLADFINLHSVIMSPGDVMIALGDALSAYAFFAWGTIATIALANAPEPRKN